MRRANEETTTTGAQSWVKVTHHMLVVEQRRAALITLPIEIIMLLQLEWILCPLLEGTELLSLVQKGRNKETTKERTHKNTDTTPQS
jgi:hypothetical protein